MSRGHGRRVSTDPREPIPWRVLQDSRISFRARGVLCYLLSLPDGWEASAERIAKDTTEGRDAVATALKELEGAGYLVRRKYQAGGGKWDWLWLYSDTPDELAENLESELAKASGTTVDALPVDGKPGDGATSDDTLFPQVNPSTEKPSTDEPSTENQGTKKEPLTGEGSKTSFVPDKSEDEEEPPREDVDLLCQRLYDRVTGNGSKAKITNTWRREARLLLDRDGRELDKALNLIDWCQNDPFWRSNVLSMPTFRKQYDQIRLKARAEWEKTQGRHLRVVDPTTGRAVEVPSQRPTMRDPRTGMAVER